MLGVHFETRPQCVYHGAEQIHRDDLFGKQYVLGACCIN